MRGCSDSISLSSVASLSRTTLTLLFSPLPLLRPGGERIAPSGAGADFSFASSDFKTLGAFFCNFPSLDGRRLQSGAAWVSASGAPARERRLGSIACLFVAPARLPRFFLGFERFHCFARRKISFRPRASNSTTFLRPPAGAHGQPRARVPDVVASRLPRPYHSRARIQSFQAVAAPFPGDSVLPSRQEICRAARDRLGSEKKSESAATADPPPCGAARRDAR